MKELWKTANGYYRTFEEFRLRWWVWGVLGCFVLCTASGFVLSCWQLIQTVFSGHPFSYWAYILKIALWQMATLGPFLLLARHRTRRTLREFGRSHPSKKFAHLSEARVVELTRITGKHPSEFFPLAKDLIALSADYRACGWSAAFSANDLAGMIFSETAKSRIPGMFASLAAVFGGLVLAKQADANDTRWLMTDEGLRAFGLQIYLPMLALAVVSWMSLRSLWNVARPALASVICHLGGAAADNEEVINYFIADLLRYHETGFAPAREASSVPVKAEAGEPPLPIIRLLPAVDGPREPEPTFHPDDVAEGPRLNSPVDARS